MEFSSVVEDVSARCIRACHIVDANLGRNSLVSSDPTVFEMIAIQDHVVGVVDPAVVVVTDVVNADPAVPVTVTSDPAGPLSPIVLIRG